MERNPVPWLPGRHDRGIGITLEHGRAVLSNPRRDKNRSINALYIRGLECADGMRKLKGLPVGKKKKRGKEKKKERRKKKRAGENLQAFALFNPFDRNFFIFRTTTFLSLHETHRIRRDQRKRIGDGGWKAGTSEIRIGRRIEREPSRVRPSVCVASSSVWYSSGN